MPVSDFITHGGQTFLHKMRLFRQILRLAMLFSFCFSIIFFFIFLYLKTPTPIWITAKNSSIAAIKIRFVGETAKQTIKHSSDSYIISCQNYLHMKSTQNHLTFLKNNLKVATKLCCFFFIALNFLILLSWYLKGLKGNKKKHVSGQKLWHWRKLKLLLKIQNKASSITIGPLPLVKDSETKHIFISGTTGSGKSNCLNQLLQQLRKTKHKALIIDVTGEFVAHFFNESKDALLNPFDVRSKPWHPWIDCIQKYHYKEMAQNFVSKTSSDPFWSTSSLILITSLLEKMSQNKNYNIKVFLDILTKSPLDEINTFLKDTDAASLVDPIAEKTAASIRASTNSYVNSLSYLKETTEPFSIRKWIQDDSDNSWLFLSMLPDQRDALRPLISAWASIAIKSLLGCTPNPNRRVWFFMDELASLHQLNDLPTCLAESRKYGGCAVLGIQNIAQLEEIYGNNLSRSILDLCSTKILLRMGSFDLAQKLSKALGECEITEAQEGYSYGAKEIRDGVTVSRLNKDKPAVSPTDLLSLDNLSAYVKFPGNIPISKVKFKYVKLDEISQPFKTS